MDNCDWCDEHTRAVFTHMKRLPFFSLASLSRTERQLRALPAARRANGLNCDASAIYRIVWQPNPGRTRLPLPPTTSRAAAPLSPYPFPTLAYQPLICLSPFSSSRVNQRHTKRNMHIHTVLSHESLNIARRGLVNTLPLEILNIFLDSTRKNEKESDYDPNSDPIDELHISSTIIFFFLRL